MKAITVGYLHAARGLANYETAYQLLSEDFEHVRCLFNSTYILNT